MHHGWILIAVENNQSLFGDPDTLGVQSGHCPGCGSRITPVNPPLGFRVAERRFDVSETRDGILLVSRDFKSYCEYHGHGEVGFTALPGDGDFFVLTVDTVLAFDGERSGTRFDGPCSCCGGHETVDGLEPVRFQDAGPALEEGFHRSDLLFGTGHAKRPLIVTGPKTGTYLRRMGFRGLYLRELLPTAGVLSLGPAR